MTAAVRVEVITDPGAFEGLQQEWDDLLADSPSNCLFLTWEWLHTWWTHLAGARSLSILTVRCGDELAAIAPLARTPSVLGQFLPIGSLQFLGVGSVGSDYLDVIVRRQRESEVLQALQSHVASARMMLQLTQLRLSDSSAGDLALGLARSGWTVSTTRTDACPFIDLSSYSWESYIASLGPSYRPTFRRTLRLAQSAHKLEFTRVQTEEERRDAMATLLTLHDRRWQARGGSNAFHTPGLRSFHEELSQRALQRGWLRLFVLSLDGTPAAVLYGFRYGRVFYYYQSGFDPAHARHSVGTLAMALSIRSAMEEGAHEFDFLHGEESYKQRWARDTRPIGRLGLYPPSPLGLIYRGSWQLNRVLGKIGLLAFGTTIESRRAVRWRSA